MVSECPKGHSIIIEHMFEYVPGPNGRPNNEEAAPEGAASCYLLETGDFLVSLFKVVLEGDLGPVRIRTRLRVRLRTITATATIQVAPLAITSTASPVTVPAAATFTAITVPAAATFTAKTTHCRGCRD